MKYILCLLVVALTLCTVSAYAAYVETWEMDVDMTSAGAGSILGTALVANGGGSGTYGVDGFNYTVVGGATVGEFLDDANSSSNQGVMFADTTTSILGTGGYTVDMRIRWLQGCEGNGGQKSMGFAGAAGQGRGIEIDQDNIYSKSSGWVASGIGGQDFSQWQDWRIVVQSSGLFKVYTKGTETVLLDSPSAGDTPTKGVIGLYYGFFLGSFGGSSTTLTNYQLDYVRVAQGTEVLADHDPVVPEPGSMLALASGLIGMAGFAIRRRRA